ncbi:tail completion protein gp17 [Tellurirhabdus bombi]|uniref:tail completion protein gp17 n=1 Tax=Tellurirhabdus bombi TaxID=2907205 RepID=UPI001F2E3DA9|nr:DUF3168 domain-containing protein [Tellurirhabdus bombi]
MIGEPLFAILLANEKASNLFDNRIYATVLPQTTAYPAAVYRDEDVKPLSVRDNRSSFSGTLQIEVASPSFDQVQDGLAVIRQALDNYTGRINGFGLRFGYGSTLEAGFDDTTKEHFQALAYQVHGQKFTTVTT